MSEIDQRFANPFFAADTLLLGAEWTQRQLVVPSTFNVAQGIPGVIEAGSKERYGRAYLSWLLSERIAFNSAVEYQALSPATDGVTKIQLLRDPVELRYFDPNGLFGLVRTTVAREQGEFFDVTSGEVSPGKGTFASVDIGIGWRYPGRPLIATLEVQNLLGSHFHYEDIDPFNPRIFPRRTCSRKSHSAYEARSNPVWHRAGKAATGS